MAATSLSTRLDNRVRTWARKRHGVDAEPFVIPARRVYIVPTRLGMIYAGMVFLMFLGSMNYANNLALGLTFMLGALGLVAMHHCQRNLAGVRVSTAATTPVFAGQTAKFGIALDTDSKVDRYDIWVSANQSLSDNVLASNAARNVAHVDVSAPTRGRLSLDHVRIGTRYPFGLFRAWTYVHLPMHCIVYPAPSPRGVDPPPALTDIGGVADQARGDEDFAGLRGFQAGDSPKRIAWKTYARGHALQVKQYAGTSVASYVLDWDSLQGLGTEARLSRLCRWIEDAHAADRAYGIRLPGTEIPINVGNAHRQRCLTALALFGLEHDRASPL